jgi:hypothetical protein
MAEGGLPGSPSQTLGFPNNPMPIVFEGFTSLNTRNTRPAIENTEMYICDGWMPLGKNNLRTLPGIGPALYTSIFTGSIVYFAFANIGATPVCLVFLSTGSVWQVNTDTGALTAVAVAGTILSPSSTTIGVAQWGSQYIIIVNSASSTPSNGYFIWDGAQLYQRGTLGPQASIASGGSNYTTPPTVTAVGGTGSGATFSASTQNGYISSITVTNPGTGYYPTDYVYLAFGTDSGQPNYTAQAVVAGSAGATGTIGTISVTVAGLGYNTSTTSVQILGGGGYGATAKAVVTSGSITSISVTAKGEGYFNTATVVITDNNNTVAQASVVTMPFGISGTAVETYQSRVWVANGSKMFFTAPGQPVDFGTGDGAGAFQSTDSFLRIGFQAMKQSNGFLYMLADSSMNYISGVTTSGSPPSTTFTNQNVDPQIGTPWPGTVQVFSRNIVFANSFGVHVSYGGAVTKVSNQLDGIFSSVDVGTFNPSSAVAVVYGIHVYMLLLPIVDQVTGQTVNKLLMWDGQRWWTASQEINLIQVATQEINSVMTAYGTDGQVIYPLFQNPSVELTKTVQSRLWDQPGYFYNKVIRRVFGLVNYNIASTLPLTVTVDNGVSASTAVNPTIGTQSLSWTNSSGGTISWTSTQGTLTWGFSGISVFQFASAMPGPLAGLTISTNAPDVTLISATILEQVYQTNF